MNAIDTNVLVYAYDESSAIKRDTARRLLSGLSDTVLLWQVACEFIAASRKTGGDPSAAWDRLAELQTVFPLSFPSAPVLSRARPIAIESRVHIWDALIYAACLEAGVQRLYSEDLPGQAIAGLQIVNPFSNA
jgi:predicted nucleic acid-binding protein